MKIFVMHIFSALFLLSPFVSAANTAEIASQKNWAGTFDLTRSTSLFDLKDGGKRDGLDYRAQLKINVSEKKFFTIQGGYSQDLKYPEADDFSDTTVNFQTTGTPLGKSLLLGYRLGMNAPTSKDSFRRQNLYGALSTGLNIMANPQKMPAGLNVVGGFGYSRNFHQFETATDGRVNARDSLMELLTVSYEVTPTIAVASNFVYRSVWSYQNIQRNAFEMSQEISYQTPRNLAFAIGHSNSGSTLKPNGQTSNIEFTNDQNSIFFISMSTLF